MLGAWFLTLYIVLAIPATAMATVGVFAPFTQVDAQKTLVCYDPVRLSNHLNELSETQRADLWSESTDFLRADSPLVITLSTHMGSFDAEPMAHMKTFGAEGFRSMRLDALTLSPRKLEAFNEQLGGRMPGLDDDDLKILAVNPDYQIFRPRLSESVTSANLRSVLQEQDAGLALLLAMKDGNAREIEEIIDVTVKRYEREPSEIYGWNQAAGTFANSPFAPLTSSRFSLYLRSDSRGAFILSGDGRHLAYCQPAESAPTVRRDLKEWLTSKPVRTFIKTCGAEL